MSNEHTEIWSERWRLTALGGMDRIRLALVAVITGLTFVLYHLQGNTADVRAFGRSVLSWMISRWSDSTVALGAADTSHGWLIPIASIALIWWKRKELMAAPRKVSWMGLLVVMGALLLHWLGAKTQLPRVSLLSLIVLMWGIPYYLCGWGVARLLIFPCSYLIFCIPLNFLDGLSFMLRIAMTILTYGILNGLGLPYERVGTALFSVHGQFALEIEAPCSGIRSLLALTAITALYGYLTQRTVLKKWILFLSALPLAVIGNMVRILTIALVSEAFGQDVGTGLYHDFAGYMIFLAVTIPLMIVLGNILDTNFREAWQRWKRALLHPTS